VYLDSRFKYNNRLTGSHNAQYYNTDMDNSYESSVSYNPDYYQYYIGNSKMESNNTFFRKPSIKVGELKPINRDIKIKYRHEIFQAICWVIPILHKKWKISSINTSDCRIEVNTIENNTPMHDRYIRLYWRRGRKLPEECSIDTMSGTDTPRQEFASKLPFAYMYALAGIASSASPMSKGGKDELLFLFTYPEGRGVYIIPASSITEDQTDYFLLSYNTKHHVTIKIHIDGYSIEKRFSIFAKSWDNVRFRTHFNEFASQFFWLPRTDIGHLLIWFYDVKKYTRKIKQSMYMCAALSVAK
jgi:hypothetical protein